MDLMIIGLTWGAFGVALLILLYLRKKRIERIKEKERGNKKF